MNGLTVILLDLSTRRFPSCQHSLATGKTDQPTVSKWPLAGPQPRWSSSVDIQAEVIMSTLMTNRRAERLQRLAGSALNSKESKFAHQNGFSRHTTKKQTNYSHAQSQNMRELLKDCGVEASV